MFLLAGSGQVTIGEEDIFLEGRAADGHNSSYLGPPQIAPINNLLLPLLLHEIYWGVEGDVLSRIVLAATSVEARIDVTDSQLLLEIGRARPVLGPLRASLRRGVDLNRPGYCTGWETGEATTRLYTEIQTLLKHIIHSNVKCKTILTTLNNNEIIKYSKINEKIDIEIPNYCLCDPFTVMNNLEKKIK